VLAAALAVAVGAPAHAFEFKSETGEVTGYFDTTVSFGALWRMQSRNPSLIAIVNGGTSRDPNTDDGDLNYDRGDLVSLAAKATHDFSLKYRDYGMFARATYFYDWAVHDKKNELGPEAYDRMAHDFDLLDIYAYGRFDLGGRALYLRAGKQVVSWGESTFIVNGINILNPVNVAKLRVPGAELKEALTPTPMVWALAEVTDNLSVEGTWMAKWKKTEIDPRATFFSTNDFVSDDGNIAYTGFGRRNDQHGAAGVFPVSPTGQLVAPRSGDRDPSDGDEYGIALRYFLRDFHDMEIGLFHVNYHSRLPYVSGYRGGITAAATISNNLTTAQTAALGAAGIPAFPVGNPACTALNIPTFGALHTPANIAKLAPIVGGVANATALSALNATNGACASAAGRAGTYFVDYPESIKLWGISAAASGPFGIALQGEYSYRSNQPMQLPSAELLLAALGLANQITSTNPVEAAAVPYGTEITGYRRVKMHQVQATATKAFGPTFNAQQFVLLGEVGYTHLDLPDIKLAAPGCHLPQPGSSTSSAYNSTSTDCFATSNSWGYRLAGRLDYDNIIDGATVSPRLAFAHDVNGIGPTFNEKVKALSLGIGTTYLQKWQLDIAYTWFFGGNTYSGTDSPNAASGPLPPGQSANYASGSNYLRDRDFLSVSLSYSF
jgi:hypothetical protein